MRVLRSLYFILLPALPGVPAVSSAGDARELLRRGAALRNAGRSAEAEEVLKSISPSDAEYPEALSANQSLGQPKTVSVYRRK